MHVTLHQTQLSPVQRMVLARCAEMNDTDPQRLLKKTHKENSCMTVLACRVIPRCQVNSIKEESICLLATSKNSLQYFSPKITLI